MIEFIIGFALGYFVCYKYNSKVTVENLKAELKSAETKAADLMKRV